jgi:nifR3 family TIM-barrel protein
VRAAPRIMDATESVNAGVPVARKDEFSPLGIGPLRVWPPVVLAPMAGVTNYPFRAIARRFGAGLYVSEMITARPLVLGHAKTLRLSDFGPGESPRSLQLYGVDPDTVGQAVERLVGEGRVDHIDMNFGCPVPKVTRKGGGAAIPVRRGLLRAIVRAAVKHAGPVPVTLKFRIGVDQDLSTHVDAGRIAEEEGCAAVALHARTAADLYAGAARWEEIARLKEAVRRIPVLGNGDIWEARDALRMMRTTGCDGVVVGRGCLGRPWLFRDLADVFEGREPRTPPRFGEIAGIMREHAERLCAWFGEAPAMRSFRRHAAWYTKGFPGGAAVRERLGSLSTLEDLDRLLALIPPELPFPASAHRLPRGKSTGRQRVVLPAGWLEDRDREQAPGLLDEDPGDGG